MHERRWTRIRRGIEEQARDLGHVGVAILIIALLGAIVLPLVVDEESAMASDEARDLAAQLSDRMSYAGLAPLLQMTAARIYGEDGGSTCTRSVAELVDELRVAHMQQDGRPRPRGDRVDQRDVRRTRIVLQTYCPERTGDFDARVRAIQRARALRPVASARSATGTQTSTQASTT